MADRERTRRAMGPRLAGLGAILLFLVLVGRFWHPIYGFTAFLQFDAASASAEIPAMRDSPIYVYPGTGGYDGMSYVQIAYDPLLRSPGLRPAIDNLSYRARRIVPSALAWVIAAGDPARIARVYSLLNVAAWLVLAVLLWRLLAVDDIRSWLAWAGVLFSAGALASVRLALTDLIALTFLAGAMLALERGRKGWAIGWLAVAGLSRETSLLALPGFWKRGQDGKRADNRIFTVLVSFLAAVPLAGWMVYIRGQTGSADQGWGNFTWPLVCFIGKWQVALAAVQAPSDTFLAWTTLLALAGLTAQAAYFTRRAYLDDPWWRIGAAYGVMMLFLGTAVWDGDPGAATRVLLPMTLAFNILARRRRAALAWLLVGNLTVVSGLLVLKDVPDHPREIIAGHAGGAAYLVQAGPGWYDLEHTLRHQWTWSSGAGRLEIEIWPQDDRALQLEFSTRSLGPRTIEIRQDGVVRWRGLIGKTYESVRVPFASHAGRAVLEFSTDAPGVPENPGSNVRSLAFDLRDARVSCRP